jgi:hypothetical protein
MRRFGKVEKSKPRSGIYLRRALPLEGQPMLTEKRALWTRIGPVVPLVSEHAGVVERLITMAQQYDDRAATLGEEEWNCKGLGWDRDDRDEPHAKI